MFLYRITVLSCAIPLQHGAVPSEDEHHPGLPGRLRGRPRLLAAGCVEEALQDRTAGGVCAASIPVFCLLRPMTEIISLRVTLSVRDEMPDIFRRKPPSALMPRKKVILPVLNLPRTTG